MSTSVETLLNGILAGACDSAWDSVRQRVVVTNLVAGSYPRGRPFEPESLLSWLLAHRSSGVGLRDHEIASRLAALACAAKLGGFADLLGTRLPLVDAAEEILVWLGDGSRRAIPRHYLVRSYPESLREEASQPGYLFRVAGRMVPVANPPTVEFVFGRPEDAL